MMHSRKDTTLTFLKLPFMIFLIRKNGAYYTLHLFAPSMG